MDPDFWHTRWNNNEIAFHEDQPNPALTRHFNALGLDEKTRVFVPLCGMSNDIGWLLSKGHSVVGIELNKDAVSMLFENLGMKPEIETVGTLERYRGKNIDIYVGNFFDLSKDVLGDVDAVYDRGSLVALPEDMRQRYTSHLMQITENAPQLVVCYDYDQTKMDGPPFSVPEEKVEQYYADRYHLQRIYHEEIPGGFKGQNGVFESIWHLS